MFNILIVDDEKRERAGLEFLIRKYKYPLEVIQAQNGEEALEIFENTAIDILLTDIKMPFMTGIELIEHVRKKGYDPFCIIFSAYGEFEYAQNAISLGVIQYLLKPISRDDFQKLFQKVLKLCEEKQAKQSEALLLEKEKKSKSLSNAFRDFLYYLEEGCFQDGTEQLLIRETIAGHHCRLILLSSYSVLFSAHWKEFQQEILQITCPSTWIITINDMQVLLLVPVDDNEEPRYIRGCCDSIIKVSTETYQADIFLAVSPVCKEIEEMRAAYEKLRETLDYQFFMTGSTCILYDREYSARRESDMLPVLFNRILTNARLRNQKAVAEEFENVFQYIDENVGFSSLYIKYSFTDLTKKLCETLEKQTLLPELMDRIYEAKTLDSLKQTMLDFVSDINDDNPQGSTEGRLVRLARQMISEKYNDVSLGVAMIADELHVTPAYLSTLFKMETGQTMIKYITAYRMEQAKFLLKTGNMKVGDVASRCGYVNASYFISLFRNREGCSPQQYREKMYHGQADE